MSGIDISRYLSNPKALQEEDVLVMVTELQQTPWCATYRMLVAKGYDNENSYLKNKHLRLASAYVGDREQLFTLMYDQTVLHKEEVKHVPTEEEPIEDSEFKDTSQTEEYQEKAVEVAVDDNIEAISEPLLENVTEVASPLEIEELAKEENNVEEILGKEATTEVHQDNKEKEIEERHSIDFEEIVTYDPLKELVPIEKEHEDRVEIPFDFVAYNPERELEKLIDEKEGEQHVQGKDFLFWLNNVNETPKKKNKAKSPDKVHDLLEQFLATKRNRPLKPREFYKAEVKAEESEVDNMDVVSETLLELYVKQHYYSKAIDGYQKLSLLNPPKSAYFAARIKEIQQLEKDK